MRLLVVLVLLSSSFAIGAAPAKITRPAGLLSKETPMIVLDAHEDVLLRIAGRNEDLADDSYGQGDIPKWRRGGINAVWFALWVNPEKYPGQKAVGRVNELMDSLRSQVAQHPKDLALCDTAEEVRNATASGRIACLMGIEGGAAINNSLELLKAYRLLGVRYMTLTWRRNLKWAGSSESSNPEMGLSELGKEIIAEMNRVGILVDLSHASDTTFYDVIKVTTKPVIVSHSNARALSPHPRNITDEMLRALAENGGVIGVNFWDEMLRGKDSRGRKKAASTVSVETVLDHIDHIVKVAGIDHVGLGSDWEGTSSFACGLGTAAEMHKVIEGLRARGYTEEHIRKISGENFLRVLRENE